jgi:hypothetical protein
VRGVLQRRFAHSYIQQFHPHKGMNDFVKFPARHGRHPFLSGRAHGALALMRAGRSLSNRIERARLSLDLTVPTGHSSSSAASL